MHPLHQLIQDETQSRQALAAAVSANAADLHALYDALNTRHAAYCRLFEPLLVAARQLQMAIPEVHAYGLYMDEHRWGDSGLKSVSHNADGFTRIVTFQCIREPKGQFLAYIPTRYLGLDGESLMQADAARIQQDINARQKAKAAADVLEQRERAE